MIKITQHTLFPFLYTFAKNPFIKYSKYIFIKKTIHYYFLLLSHIIIQIFKEILRRFDPIKKYLDRIELNDKNINSKNNHYP